MEKDTEKSFELVAKYTTSNKNLINFGIIIGLLAIAFISISHPTPVVYAIQRPFGTNYFLHNDTALNVTYSSKIMNTSFNTTVPVAYINYTALPNGDTLLQNWTSDELNFSLIPAGVSSIHIHSLKIGGANHVIRLFYTFGIINATGENYRLLGTSELSPEVLETIPYVEADMNLLQPDINVNKTDRITISIYANQIGIGVLPDLQLTFDDLTDSRFIFPIGI